jgi:hypothetical protein
MSTRPGLVTQSCEKSCWAACMESWTYAAWYFDKRTEQQLLWTFGDKDDGCRLDPSSTKYMQFLLTFDLKEQIRGAGQMTARSANAILGTGDYFMFIEQQDEGSSHARLAYACDGGILRAMDPDPTNGGFVHCRVDQLGKILILKS